MASRSTRSTQYFGIQITLSAATPQQLLALLQAVDPNISGSVRQLSIQNDSTSPAVVLVGDAAISTSRYGYQLNVGSSKTYQGTDTQAVPLGAIFFYSTGAAILNVEGYA